MGLGCLWRTLGRVAFSLLCAGIFYFVWMGSFILSAKLNSDVVEITGWLLAPVVTAAGFATGVAILNHLTETSKARFFRIYTWPLMGCAIGAGVVYWFGPMLIVFGMFAVGTLSVALRDVVLSIRKNRWQRGC